jgi:hypothetical protein
MFISILYMFRAAMWPSSGELIVSIRHLVYARNMSRIEINIHQKQLCHFISSSSFIVYFSTILHLLKPVFHFNLILNQIRTLYATIL